MIFTSTLVLPHQGGGKDSEDERRLKLIFLYDFIFLMFALFSIPKFLVRLNQAKNSKQLFLQRFGFFSDSLKAKFAGKKIVWLHAVSVGEVNAARGWIQLFLAEYPEWTIALSTTTPTGQTVADSLVTDRVVVFYAPFDLSFVVRRVLKDVSPQVILLMETEIWPNLIGAANQTQIPIGIINGRISPRSFSRYRFIRFWLKSILNQLSFCLVQSDRDRFHFGELGMPEEKLISIGNMKFDVNGQVKDQIVSRPKGIGADSLIYIGGSTHWNEEKVLIWIFRRLRESFPNLKLILAPRHPEHLPKVEEAVQKFNFSYCLFSEVEQKNQPYDVLLVDRMGILASLYSVADLVFVGGSFAKRGGQNPIEAAGFKKPILHGPNVVNFYEAYSILDEQNAAFQVASEEELYQQSRKLLEHPELRNEMGARAWASIQSMKGATARTMNYLSRWMVSRDSSVALVESQ